MCAPYSKLTNAKLRIVTISAVSALRLGGCGADADADADADDPNDEDSFVVPPAGAILYLCVIVYGPLCVVASMSCLSLWQHPHKKKPA